MEVLIILVEVSFCVCMMISIFVVNLIWNSDLFHFQFRDVVRHFIKGTDGFSGAFAECLCGSPNLYQVKSTSVILRYLHTI